MMKAFVDKETCVGCGLCAGTAPDVFRMNDEDKAEAYAEVADAAKAEAVEAMDGCPVQAITMK